MAEEIWKKDLPVIGKTILRRATSEDGASVNRLFRSAKSRSMPFDFLRAFLKTNFLVAENDGQVIAFSAFDILEPGLLFWAVISQGFRRSAVGKNAGERISETDWLMIPLLLLSMKHSSPGTTWQFELMHDKHAKQSIKTIGFICHRLELTAPPKTRLRHIIESPHNAGETRKRIVALLKELGWEK